MSEYRSNEDHESLTTYEARWVEQTVETRALLSQGITGPLKATLEEVDQNLRDFRDGNYPPGSDELHGIYYDAITRAAIPHSGAPMSAQDVAQQLHTIGIPVPTIDLDTISHRTGITPLHPHDVATALTTPQPTHDAPSPDVTIYGLPNCVGCAATERTLNKAGIPYDKIDLTDRPDLVEMFKAQGLTQAPIVETNGDRWSGYRPDKLKAHNLHHRTRNTPDTGTER